MAGEKGTVYVVATSHLDTQWRWTFRDTILRYLPATMRENFDLFERFPNYTFSFEGAYRYRLMKEYFPADFERLKGYVAAGRWTVCGSSVDAGDVNTVSPESLVRQALYGNGFFQRELGVKSRDIFLPDCFGFGWALPSVAAHCGLRGFSTSKLEWGSSVGIPFSIGFWEGPDGQGLVAQINPGQYSFGIKSDPASDPVWIEKVAKTNTETGMAIGYRYFGLGDTGGAPDAASVELLEKAIGGDGPLRVISAPADRLCQELTDSQVAALPRHKSEFLLIEHGTGTYTANGQMKRWNRLNESRAFAAEAAATMAHWMGALPYPRALLEEAWTRVLANQMHDILPGTSIPEAYLLSWNDEVVALNQFSRVLVEALSPLIDKLDTSSKGLPVVVFNPLSFARREFVPLPLGEGLCGAVESPEGVVVPSGKDASGRLGFVAEMEPMSLSVYSICDEPSDQATALEVGRDFLENERYRVEIDSRGDIATIFDRQVGRNLLAAPHRLEFLRTAPKEWPAWTIVYGDVSAAPLGHVNKVVSIEIAEHSAARVALRVTRTGRGSRIVQEIALTAGGDRVEIATTLDWESPGVMLKAVFPLALDDAKATYDLGLGTIERGVNHERLHEVPAQLWADLTDGAGECGVAILTAGKYGWDRPAANVLRLTLVHTPEMQGFSCHLGGANFTDTFSEQEQLDFGTHRFTYAIMGHRGDWRGAVPAAAQRLNQPLLAFSPPRKSGRLGRRFSFGQLNSDAAAIVALKMAENSDEVIVRVQEQSGTPQRGLKLSLGQGIAAAREVNGMEEPLGDAEVQDGALAFDLGHYQPRSFALKLAQAVAPVAPSYRFEWKSVEVPGPFVRASSPNGNRCAGDLDGRGISFPSELLGDRVKGHAYDFLLQRVSDECHGAAVCRGQSIRVPGFGPDEFCLLACSVDGDVDATFRVNMDTFQVRIHDFRQPLGCWDNRVVNGTHVNTRAGMIPGFVRQLPLAWVASHLHCRDSNADLAYSYGYLYEYRFPLFERACELTLPDDPRLRVFAATAVRSPYNRIKPLQPLVTL